MNILQICAVVCSFISLLLLLISLGSDFWLISGSIHGGLWKACVDTVCVELGSNAGAAEHATRAFMVMGMMAGAVSFFGLCASFFVLRLRSLPLARILPIASFLAAACAMIAMAIYTGSSTDILFHFGWSFGLGWASFALFNITGVLTVLMKNDTIA